MPLHTPSFDQPDTDPPDTDPPSPLALRRPVPPADSDLHTPLTAMPPPPPGRKAAPRPQPQPQPSQRPTAEVHASGRPDFPETMLTVRAINDPVMAKLGHDPRSVYVEQFWVSVLGPSAVLLLRRMAVLLDAQPDGFDVDPLEWALELGLGARGGKHSPLWRTIDRLCRFGLAHRNGPLLSVHRQLPPLTLRQVQRLPPHLRVAHDAWRGNQTSIRDAA